MAEGARRPGALGALLRVLATAAAGIAVVWLVDLGAVAVQLRRLHAGWIAIFLLLSLPLYLLLAWRWWFTAGRLGAPLGFRRALGDYYLSTLLNQVLPFGVAGDVVRGLRHRDRLRGAETSGLAATAIVLERLSGLCALALFVAASAAVWLLRGRAGGTPIALGALTLLALLALGLAGLLGWRRLGRLREGAAAALVARGALAFQLAVSTAVVALLVLLFATAGRAAGVALAPATVIEVVPLVLAVTTVPWAFGGWGAREATVAALYRILGLDVATGVAVSVAFGLLSLAAATPGLFVLVLPGRDET